MSQSLRAGVGNGGEDLLQGKVRHVVVACGLNIDVPARQGNSALELNTLTVKFLRIEHKILGQLVMSLVQDAHRRNIDALDSSLRDLRRPFEQTQLVRLLLVGILPQPKAGSGVVDEGVAIMPIDPDPDVGLLPHLASRPLEHTGNGIRLGVVLETQMSLNKTRSVHTKVVFHLRFLHDFLPGEVALEGEVVRVGDRTPRGAPENAEDRADQNGPACGLGKTCSGGHDGEPIGASP